APFEPARIAQRGVARGAPAAFPAADARTGGCDLYTGQPDDVAPPIAEAAALCGARGIAILLSRRGPATGSALRRALALGCGEAGSDILEFRGGGGAVQFRPFYFRVAVQPAAARAWLSRRLSGDDQRRLHRRHGGWNTAGRMADAPPRFAPHRAGDGRIMRR